MRIEALYKVDTSKVTWADIKAKRDALEQSPLELPGMGKFDVDTLSMERMRIALDNFEVLPTLNADGLLAWKLENNTLVFLSKEMLAGIYENIMKAISIRAAILHVKAEILRSKLPHVTRYTLDKPETWGL